LGTFNLTNVEPSFTPRTSPIHDIATKLTQSEVGLNAPPIAHNIQASSPKTQIIKRSQFASLKRANLKIKKREESWTCDPPVTTSGPTKSGLPPRKVSSVTSCNNVNGQTCQHTITKGVSLSNSIEIKYEVVGGMNIPKGTDGKL
jgi:hypothetical protein